MGNYTPFLYAPPCILEVFMCLNDNKLNAIVALTQKAFSPALVKGCQE